MNLSTEHKALFSLLRAGLWEREPDDLSPFPLTDAQWWEVYRMSVRQTVAGTVFRGLHHLPEEYLPADALMIHWVAKADRIERKNRRMDAALRLLLQRMGREGLHPVLLKGQGVAALYGHPLLRECGDIDLYFPSEKEEREAAELMRRAGCRTERQPDGSVCYSWQGVEVEHHTRLFDLHNPLLRGYLSALVGRHGFTDIRTEDGASLPVPAPLPNLLLLNAHLLKHIMGHGVGLRQFCDMARAYHALRGSYSPVELEAAYRRTGLLGWSAQLHTFLTEHLGLPRDVLEGLHPVLLKGQGVAALYGHPLLRECGDIDLYFPSEKEEREAAELMRRAGCRTERQPDGSVCYSWQGVEVEHHTRLFDLHNPLLRGYLSALVGRHGFTDIRTEDGASLPVPAPLPNLLLLNAHLLKHIMGHGVGLRQFCDMARAYHALRGSYSPVELEAAYRRTGLLGWSAQLHTFLTEHLGLPRDVLPYAGTDARTSPRLLHIVLEGGNFGQYGKTRAKASRAGWERKLHTFLSFWRHRDFSGAYARGEAFWTSIRLITGNLR